MNSDSLTARQLFNKVPEITLFFWIIKILCTTVGETAADFLNVNLNLGLTGTSVITGALLIIVLFFQFRTVRYVPRTYWLAVTLISVFGTLVTDNLSAQGLALETSTLIFSGLLALTFLGWYISEKTLSIHSICTRRREMFYWTTILFTFALGTATGDLVSEGLGVGYFMTGLLVATIILVTAIAWRLRLNSILSFWIIYILTRPLGASLGDLLSQSPKYGGLGLGPTITSFIFLIGILGIVTYLSITKRDVIASVAAKHTDESKERGGLWQTVVVLALFVILGGMGYHIRHAAIQVDASATTDPSGTPTTTQSTSPLGDTTVYKIITQDTLDKLNAGDQAGATVRISDLEHEWDTAQSRLKAKDSKEWTKVDGKIDTVLRLLRAVNPNPASEKVALEGLLSTL